MTMNMKGWALLLLLLMPVLAMAEGPVLETSLPEDALLIENVEFDDGDFIRTYQVPEGGTVQMLRYESFDMTLDDLAEGEWTGYASKEALDLSTVDGWPAEGIHLMMDGEDGTLNVCIVLVRVDEQTLIFQTVLGEDGDPEQIQEWVNDLRIEQEESVING